MAALQQRLSSLVLGLSLVLLSGCHFTERAPHDSATDARPIVLTTFKQRRVPAIFCESTESDKAQRQLAKAAETRLGGTFYMDSLSSPDGPASTLLELQRHNVDLIRCGLSGEVGPQ